MPALVEQPVEQVEVVSIAAVSSLPVVEPHNRHKPRHATRNILLTGICAALIVVGVVWRAWQLDQFPGVNGDEAWYGVQSQRFLDEYVYGKTLPEADRVDFRTPTGNVWNLFLMIPRVVLDATFAPSVWSLRLPALISGVLTLIVNWWLCRRALNRTTAWLTTALLAVLPIAVIYSRLGWDTCQSISFCLPLVYLPWIAERRALSAARTAVYFALSLVSALLVHPTNIFVVPLSAALFWPRVSAASQLKLSLRSRLMLTATAISSAAALGISRGAWAGVALSNVTSALAQWAGDIVGLFNGAMVYGSISLPAEELLAAQRWLLLLSLPTVALLIWARIACKIPLFHMVSGWYTRTNGKGVAITPETSPLAEHRACHPETHSQRYAALFDGTGLALLCFLGVAGPTAVQPGYERYGLWIIAPGSLLIVLAYAKSARRSQGFLVALTILAIVQVTLLLTGYWQYYQQRFDVPAAEQRLAHWTYRTDNFADWPEMSAEFESTLTSASNSSQKIIYIEQKDPQRWWFEWKWRYLSYGSEYEWHVIARENDALVTRKAGEHRWMLRSQKQSAKEKLAIQYLAD